MMYVRETLAMLMARLCDGRLAHWCMSPLHGCCDDDDDDPLKAHFESASQIIGNTIHIWHDRLLFLFRIVHVYCQFISEYSF
jgi:hypothetical protein